MSIRSLRSAVAFLTVIPAADAAGSPGERLGRAYFPLVGAAVGLAAGVAFVVVAAIAGRLLAAVAAVAVLAALTGGLHLDGLADAADGLFGVGSLERRLEVMRDPRVGSFGAVTLVLVIVGDVAALSSLSPARALVGLVVAGALSRLAMLAVVVAAPYRHESGLGTAAQGGRRAFDLLLGAAFTVAACLLDPRRAVMAALMVALAATVVVVVARRRIGGATGDIYGAVSEIGQLAALVTFVAAG
ncbi:MAG TPA: adenosylcobinamide-GDP ribazoletransferase [Candidatus Dormibacteraeota bacterium]|nr:adenosylcobinamide-GDP ribazoletransferase [Candidatus Dormibacteraeota bacterium]